MPTQMERGVKVDKGTEGGNEAAGNLVILALSCILKRAIFILHLHYHSLPPPKVAALIIVHLAGLKTQNEDISLVIDKNTTMYDGDNNNNNGVGESGKGGREES